MVRGRERKKESKVVRWYHALVHISRTTTPMCVMSDWQYVDFN